MTFNRYFIIHRCFPNAFALLPRRNLYHPIAYTMNRYQPDVSSLLLSLSLINNCTKTDL